MAEKAATLTAIDECSRNRRARTSSKSRAGRRDRIATRVCCAAAATAATMAACRRTSTLVKALEATTSEIG